MAWTLNSAVSWPPEITAPAWPMRRPGGAVRPAMKPTTGFLVFDALRNCRALDLGVAADLADHDDALGLGIGQEHLQALDEVGAVHRIAADADAGRWPRPDRRGLRHRLVGERAGARDDADLAALVDVARHDADLALAGVMTPGQFGPIRRELAPPSARFTRTMSSTGMPSVMQRRPAGSRRRSLRGSNRRHRAPARRSRWRSPRSWRRPRPRCRTPAGRDGSCRPSRRHAAHHLGAVGDRLLGMEGALRAVKPWQMTLVFLSTRTAIGLPP